MPHPSGAGYVLSWMPLTSLCARSAPVGPGGGVSGSVRLENYYTL